MNLPTGIWSRFLLGFSLLSAALFSYVSIQYNMATFLVVAGPSVLSVFLSLDYSLSNKKLTTLLLRVLAIVLLTFSCYMFHLLSQN